MKRNVKKEKIVIAEKEFTFIQFAESCYKAQKRNETFNLYLIKNKKLLTEQWDTVKKAAKENMIKLIDEEKPITTKITEKIVKFFDKLLPKL